MIWNNNNQSGSQNEQDAKTLQMMLDSMFLKKPFTQWTTQDMAQAAMYQTMIDDLRKK